MSATRSPEELLPFEVIEDPSEVTVMETAGFREGEGLRVRLVGPLMRIDVSTEEADLTAWCPIMDLLEAICLHTREIGN